MPVNSCWLLPLKAITPLPPPLPLPPNLPPGNQTQWREGVYYAFLVTGLCFIPYIPYLNIQRGVCKNRRIQKLRSVTPLSHEPPDYSFDLPSKYPSLVCYYSQLTSHLKTLVPTWPSTHLTILTVDPTGYILTTRQWCIWSKPFVVPIAGKKTYQKLTKLTKLTSPHSSSQALPRPSALSLEPPPTHRTKSRDNDFIRLRLVYSQLYPNLQWIGMLQWIGWRCNPVNVGHCSVGVVGSAE